jgi:hypothetical protein
MAGSVPARPLLMLFLLVLTGGVRADDYAALQGFWQCQEGGVPYTLNFPDREHLLYNGEKTTYQLAPNMLIVQEEYGPVGYYYQLEGKSLTFYNADGSTAQCKKGKKPLQAAKPKSPAQGGVAASGTHSAGAVVPGKNWPVYARPQGRVAWDTTDPQTLVYKFAGRWDYATSNTLSNLYLKPDGSYEEAYEAGYGGTFEDQGGYQTGAWGTTGGESSKGYWTIEGTLERGVITLYGNDGSRRGLDYRVYVRNGEYFGDYYFNGKLHTVKYLYR